MDNSNDVFAKTIDRRAAARILGLENSNHIAVWIGRKYLVPAQIDPAGGARRQFRFSFVNMVEMAILKELNYSFNVEYSLGSRILGELFGPSGERLNSIIQDGKGIIVIAKKYRSTKKPLSRPDITSNECDILRKDEDFEVKFLKNSLNIGEIAENSDYIMIINLKKVIERLKKEF